MNPCKSHSYMYMSSIQHLRTCGHANLASLAVGPLCIILPEYLFLFKVTNATIEIAAHSLLPSVASPTRLFSHYSFVKHHLMSHQALSYSSTAPPVRSRMMTFACSSATLSQSRKVAPYFAVDSCLKGPWRQPLGCQSRKTHFTFCLVDCSELHCFPFIDFYSFFFHLDCYLSISDYPISPNAQLG